MENHPGPRDLQHPDELKWTPNTAMDMRFGRRGESRPNRSVQPEADQIKPVNHNWARNKTEIMFTAVFAMVGIVMVLGALYAMGMSRYIPGQNDPEPTTETAADVTDEEPRELQGGVEVRKGFGGN